MALGFEFEKGIVEFFTRRGTIFDKSTFEGSFQKKIEYLRQEKKEISSTKPKVVVLGRGPAGLMRAIQALMNGHSTTVVEKRSKDADGRSNSVALTKITIDILKYYGIYQYLMEHKLIFPPFPDGTINVRLGDLEEAMLEILYQLNHGSVIEYDSQVEKLALESEKVAVTLKCKEGDEKTISQIDILINSEGSRSTTNAKMGINRVEILPQIPVIAAIFKDERPSITGIGSLCSYVGKSMVYVAVTIYYNVQFFFCFLFSSHFRGQIKGSIILKTPGQNYLGCGFSDEINHRLQALQEKIKTVSHENQKKLEKEYDSFARHWIRLSICHANLVSLISWYHKGPHMLTGAHLSLESFQMINIGADRATEYIKKMGKTTILLAGDTSATVDPTTGLGCNTAIQSSVDFLDFIWGQDEGISQDRLVEDYNSRTEERVRFIHNASVGMRKLYRPDALTSMSMFMLRQDQ